MKKFIICIVLLLLTGCSTVDVNNVYNDLNDLLDNLDFSYGNRVNNSDHYYSYYLPSDMQEYDGNTNASVIAYNSSKTVINLNIASLINKAYYSDASLKDEGFLKNELIDYKKEGSFTKDDGETSDYLFVVYKYENQYLLHFITDDINAYATSDAYDLTELARRLFIIAKSVRVDKESVLADYSKKDIIETERTPNNLFEYITPASGFLSELVSQSGGEVINETQETSEVEETEPVEEENQEAVEGEEVPEE